MKTTSFLSFILVVAWLQWSIAQEGAGSDGKVRRVSNPKERTFINDGGELERTLRLGVAEGDRNQMFFRISDLAVDGTGRIYVLERGNKRIQVFDSEGDYLRTIGKGGDGPGEFRNPAALFLWQDRKLYVLDTKHGRISAFDLKGEFIHSFQTKQQPVDLVVTSHEQVLVLESGDPKYRLFRYSREGDLLTRFGELKKGANRFETSMLNRGKIAVDLEDNLYYANRITYWIEQYDRQGALRSHYSKEVGYDIILPETNVDEQGDRIVVSSNIYTNTSVDIQIHGGKIYHAVTKSGSLLGGAEIIDVFDLKGSYLHSIALPYSIKNFAVDSAGNLYLVNGALKDFLGKDVRVPGIEKFPIPRVLKAKIN